MEHLFIYITSFLSLEDTIDAGEMVSMSYDLYCEKVCNDDSVEIDRIIYESTGKRYLGLIESNGKIDIFEWCGYIYI